MAQAEASREKIETEDLSDFYADKQDGYGFNEKQLSLPLLLINQPTTDDRKIPGIEKGHFYNSQSLKDYGTKVRVIPVFSSIVYYEWQPAQKGLAGKYTPAEFEGMRRSGDVIGEAFKGWYRGLNGNGEPIQFNNPEKDLNKFIETWVYVFILPDHLEDGFICYGSTLGNMKYLKQWHIAMETKRFPNGKKIPKIAQIWELNLEKDFNDAGQQSYHFGSSKKSACAFSGLVDKSMFYDYVNPVQQIAGQIVSKVEVQAELPDYTQSRPAEAQMKPAEDYAISAGKDEDVPF